MTTTLIVDDEFDMRLLVRTVIELANEGLHVVGEAVDGLDAFVQWKALGPPEQPDVVILDNRMPGATGLEVAERILRERNDQKILLFSAFIDSDVVAKAAAIGVSRCVSKDDIDSLPLVIREIA